jgi:hypothetical protein
MRGSRPRSRLFPAAILLLGLLCSGCAAMDGSRDVNGKFSYFDPQAAAEAEVGWISWILEFFNRCLIPMTP